MDFSTIVQSDFKQILSGEFATDCTIVSKATGEEYSTKGIFDNTFEPVQTLEGGRLLQKFARLVIYDDCPFTVKQFDQVSIAGKTYRVNEPQKDSENNLVLWLKE